MGAVIAKKSPRQLAVIGLRGIPDVIGGIESHCKDLLPRLQGRLPGIKFVVYARAPYVDSSITDYHGIEIVPLWSVRLQRIEAFVHTFTALLHARFVRGISMVNIHGVGPGFFTPLGRLLGMVVIVTHHGQDYKRPGFGRAAKMITRIGEKLAVLFAHRLIAVSRLISDDLKQRYPSVAGRIVHIPNGISSEWGAEPAVGIARADELAQLSEIGVEPGKYVLAVGRIDPGKGMDDLINAFERSNADGKVLIIGSAVSVTPFSRQLMAKATDRIVFGGFHPHTTMRFLYRNASLFVLPSLHEGLSISLLEALASGTPVLVSDIGANTVLDLPPQCYFPVGNVDALAEALGRPHAEFAAGDRFHREQYNWENVAQQTADIYQPLLNGNLAPLSQS
jgi:glycosyltransferase involved in cell wall biosynthesis